MPKNDILTKRRFAKVDARKRRRTALVEKNGLQTRKKRALPARIATVCALALCLLFLIGCVKGAETAATQIDARTPEPTAKASPAPTKTPALTPTEEPEMVIEEDGDITLRSDIAAQFTARTYTFDAPPVVFLYHTHATEAFRKDPSDDYIETERGRTENTDYNIVGLGTLLADALEKRGFVVIHDTTNVEAPDLSSAYSRSLALMERCDDADIYLDLHRNASNQRGKSDNTVEWNGAPYAKLFFVVGTGIGTYDGEYDVSPDWRANYTFAYSLAEAVADVSPQLVKPIRLKVGRYNQHMGLCLLAEVGTNADSLLAAQNTITVLADALQRVCLPAA